MKLPEFITYLDPQLGTIVRLQNNDLSAEIAVSCGSNLISLTHKGRQLIHVNKENLLEHGYTGCFVLYPFPNRIRDRKFTFEGTLYSLDGYPKRVADDALIHGVAHDATWSIETEPKINNDSIVFSTSMNWNDSQEYFPTFPVTSKLMLTYILSKQEIKIEYDVLNTSDKNMPFGFALHPSFERLSGDETTIALPAKKVMRMDEKLLPTWEALDLDQVMFRQFDLRQPIPVTAALRLDHVFTNLIPNEHVIIAHPNEKLSVHVSASEDCKFVVLHTLGKDRTIEVEPQTCSTDAFNAPDPTAGGLISLKPDERHVGFIQYAVVEM